MLYKDKLTVDTVLKHKSYFDERLVEIVESLRISDSKKSINVNLKMYSFDHLRMYNFDHIDT